MLFRSLNAGDAEHFINFAEVDKYTTPYRIRYVLQVEDDGTGTKVLVGSDNVAQDVADSIKAANGAAVVEYNNATDDEISVVLKPKSEVSRVDLKWMEYIFADGDLPLRLRMRSARSMSTPSPPRTSPMIPTTTMRSSLRPS